MLGHWKASSTRAAPKTASVAYFCDSSYTTKVCLSCQTATLLQTGVFAVCQSCEPLCQGPLDECCNAYARHVAVADFMGSVCTHQNLSMSYAHCKHIAWQSRARQPWCLLCWCLHSEVQAGVLQERCSIRLKRQGSLQQEVEVTNHLQKVVFHVVTHRLAPGFLSSLPLSLSTPSFLRQFSLLLCISCSIHTALCKSCCGLLLYAARLQAFGVCFTVRYCAATAQHSTA